MPVQIIDTHAHIDMSQFDYDRAEMLQRAADAGVTDIVTVGIDLASSKAAIKLAEAHKGIHAAVGCHPQEVKEMQPGDIKEIAVLAADPAVVAIGEIGLDYYRSAATRDIQLKVLKSQLELAAKVKLPVIIHCRQADADMILLLTEWVKTLPPELKSGSGVIHCFNGDVPTAEKYLNLGFYIAFGAYTGYPTSKLDETIRFIPEDRILTETDCPFLPPQTHRGKRNEPSYLPGTLGTLARVRTTSFDTLARQTVTNAKQLFFKFVTEN
jgi:TatD DNase family protein